MTRISHLVGLVALTLLISGLSANAQQYYRYNPQTRQMEVIDILPYLPRPYWHPSQPQYESPTSPRNLCAGSWDPDCRIKMEQLQRRNRNR